MIACREALAFNTGHIFFQGAPTARAKFTLKLGKVQGKAQLACRVLALQKENGVGNHGSIISKRLLLMCGKRSVETRESPVLNSEYVKNI